ncbi:hypothetical protein [Streptomyces sp. NRRL S-1314]|uniref:hypothetical protein n=1 Tax=Streptomyces TaxID=1883 RepID=UPI0004C8E598|nr:hypothetical protein [Streptomyces sp. NRRL S-1314]
MTGTAPATQAVLLRPGRLTRPAPRTGVTRIGVTGHRAIPAAVEPVVRAGMRALFHGDGLSHDDGGDGLSHGDGDGGPLEALTSLAAGADQIFADIALANGVPVTAVIPGTDHEAGLGDAATLRAYRRILRSCAKQERLPPEPTREAAYLAAGRWIVDHADHLVAVWDGLPARGVGGTGDVVAYARRTGVPVTVLWRPGVVRD